MKEDSLNEAVGILTRREIEARILKPFYEAMCSEIGEDKTKAILRDIVISEAKTIGASMRKRTESDSVKAFSEQWEPWFRGGALEIEELENTETTWQFNVTRCRYAEMYRELGMAELGATLSCNRDGALVEGYSDKIAFQRTQTLMEGASCCDFKFSVDEKDL